MDGLYILPFDHRGSFMKLIKASSTPTKKDIVKARAFKQLIYDAFRKSVAYGVSKKKAAILVDEWLGRHILVDAKSKGFITCIPLEKSGKDEFEFERSDWKKLLDELKPSYAKVLVRYNPEGDKKMNRRQVSRLAELSRYLHFRKKKFLFELLIPATKKQLEIAGSLEAYEHKIRPKLMVAAIRELQGFGVNPDVWKLEGLDSAEMMRKVAEQVNSKNPKARIAILGRGEGMAKVKRWLRAGAKVSSVIGFVIGRTVFSKPLEDYAAGRITRDKAVKRISDSYKSFVDFWEKLKSE